MSFLLLILAFLGWIAAEIYMFIKFCHRFDALSLLVIIVVTAFVGWRLLKRESLMMLLLSVQAGMAEGNLPQKIMEGLLVFASALLLLLPGLIGDVIGLLLLVNPVRYLVARGLVWWFRKAPAKKGAGGAMPRMGWHFSSMSGSTGASGTRPGPDDAIDVDAREISQETEDNKKIGK